MKTHRRIAVSLFTMLFWIPAAVRLGYRHLTNAYSSDSFVSQRNLDAAEIRLAELLEKIRSELIRVGFGSFPSYSIREILERYAGLSGAAEEALPPIDDVPADLFEAAGRTDDKLATACLMRRNRRRIERHHTKARRDFVALFERASAESPAAALRALQLGIELAIQLDDRKAADALDVISAQIRDEVWNLDGQQTTLDDVPRAVSSLAMKTLPLNND